MLGRALAHADREETTLTQDERSLRLSVVPELDKTGEVATLVVTLIDVTEIVQARERLSESEARLSALMEKTTVIFAMKDMKGDYLFANRRFIEFFGIDANDYAGKSDFMLLPPPLAADLWNLDLAALRERVPITGEHLVECADGRRQLKSVHQVLCDAQGQPTAFVVEAEDITIARHAEEQMRITARVFDQAGEAIVVTDANTVIQTVNAAFTRITGYTQTEAVGQRTALLKSGRHSPEFYHAMWQALRDVGYWQGETWNRRKNGELYPE